MIKQRTGIDPELLLEQRIDIQDYYDKLIVPHTKAPTIVQNGDILILKEMNFSLIPRWSKDRKPKFATHNARIETVADKPTWRDAFRKRHCLVPLTHFIEPIYEGEYAGNMVAFHLPNSDLLYAAGIWEEWTDKSTGEVIESFAIITGNPPKFVESIGHDRCPVFLDLKLGKKWLSESEENADSGIKLLTSQSETLELDVEKFRPMRDGWQKRAGKGK